MPHPQKTLSSGILDPKERRFIQIGFIKANKFTYKRTLCSKKIPLPFTCEKCGYRFSESMLLDAHRSIICKFLLEGQHGRNTSVPFGVCEICLEGFLNPSHLIEHMNAVHLSALEDSQNADFPSASACSKNGEDYQEALSYVTIGTYGARGVVRFHHIQCLPRGAQADWRCVQCGTGFDRQLHLDNHLTYCYLLRNASPPFCVCARCCLTFENPAHLGAHMERHREDVVSSLQTTNKRSIQIECKPCSLILDKFSALAGHATTCTQEFQCENSSKSTLELNIASLSGKTFKMTKIKVKHDSENHYQFLCHCCQYHFPTLNIVKLHLPFCLTIKDHKLLICSECSEGFETMDKLQSHLLSHLSIHNALSLKPTVNAVYFGKANGPSDTDVSFQLMGHSSPDQLVFSCTSCLKWFHSLFYYMAHFTVCDVNTKEMYICPLCCISFKTSKDLTDHLKRDRLAENLADIVCCQIGKNSYSPGAKLIVVGQENRARFKRRKVGLKYTYIYLTQTYLPATSNNVTCDVCGYNFEDNVMLYNLHWDYCLDHFLNRSSQPFGFCDYCKLGFNQLKDLCNHMNTHRTGPAFCQDSDNSVPLENSNLIFSEPISNSKSIKTEADDPDKKDLLQIDSSISKVKIEPPDDPIDSVFSILNQMQEIEPKSKRTRSDFSPNESIPVVFQEPAVNF